MQSFATVVLPERFRYFKKDTNLELVDEFLNEHLNRYKQHFHKFYEFECECKDVKIMSEVYRLFQNQIKELYKSWDQLSFKQKEMTTIYRIDPKLTQIIKGYLELEKEKTSFQPTCVCCSGTGISKININPEERFRSFNRIYSPDQIWKTNSKYPVGIEKVKNITRETRTLILPDQTWLDRPLNSIFDFYFHDISPQEWSRDIFFKELEKYHSNFAVLVAFNK